MCKQHTKFIDQKITLTFERIWKKEKAFSWYYWWRKDKMSIRNIVIT